MTMDAVPNCAICSAPSHAGCPCESERLQIALDQAEGRAMDHRLDEIRYAPNIYHYSSIALQ